ncbi:MAG: thermonuclease family protein [Proteobacteria bacterium]|nr:thermonuclease family protein [Pseudomonadota bacterium]
MNWRRRNRGYGQVLPTYRWQGLSRRQRLWRTGRWWLTALLTAAVWVVIALLGARTPDPPGVGDERVAQHFVVCGQHGSSACAPDGDTIIIGVRHIRIIGIDAPELHPPRCPTEEAKGIAARTALLTLLNQGPFFLTGPKPVAHDGYGRELHTLVRVKPDGTVQSLGQDMIASGTARSYLRGPRLPWC